MRHTKQKLKRFSLAILAGLALCAHSSLAEIKNIDTASKKMTVAAETKKKSTKPGHRKHSAVQKAHSAKHQPTSPKHHATWHAEHGQQSVNTKKAAAWHPKKTHKKSRRSRSASPATKAKQKNVAALPEPTLPPPGITAPPEITPQLQQLNKTVTNGLAAKPLIRRLKPATIDADTDPDRIVVEESGSPSYSLISLALLIAAGACYMYFTRRQQALVNRRQPERQSGSPTSSSKSNRSWQADGTNMSKVPMDKERISSSPKSAGEAQVIRSEDGGAPPPRDSTPETDGTAKLPAAPRCTFELFVEIQVALSAWIDQGADTLANLQNNFGLSEADWLSESSYWGPKYLADNELLRKFNLLSTKFRKKYRGSAA